MEYILQNVDLFDEDISAKFYEVLKADKENFDKEKLYKLTVSFHVNLLGDKRFMDTTHPIEELSHHKCLSHTAQESNPEQTECLFITLFAKFEEFDTPGPFYKRNKDTSEQKIYDVMDFQLDKLISVLTEYGIRSESKTIQGDNLEAENIIKIEISEDTSEPSFTGKGKGKGKNKKRMEVDHRHIIPSLPYTKKVCSEARNKIIVEKYYEFMKAIGYKYKIMSEILEIEETPDDVKLVNAFAKQYGNIWFTSGKAHEELTKQFWDKVFSVVNNHLEEK